METTRESMMGYSVVGLICFIVGVFVNYFFTKRMIKSLLQENNSGGDVVSPEVIKDITERAIKKHEMGKTTKEIIEEMNNLPELIELIELIEKVSEEIESDGKTTEKIIDEMNNLPEHKE